MNIEELKEKLYDKLDREFEEYKAELVKRYTSREIIDRAGEIAARDEIVSIIDCISFNKNEIKALLKENSILENFYQSYINSSSTSLEVVVDSIKDETKKITSKFIKNKEKER